MLGEQRVAAIHVMPLLQGRARRGVIAVSNAMGVFLVAFVSAADGAVDADGAIDADRAVFEIGFCVCGSDRSMLITVGRVEKSK